MPFSTIYGQDISITVLQRSLATGRLAHAYLFEGIEGCGKKATALAFIEAVFCGRDTGCGSCPSCRKIAAQQHPDLHLIEADGAFIKIDQIRELQRELAYRPFEAPKKACIIDGAERLNPAAGNALLKTLEEPPGDALIILVTEHRSGVLPTVLSRCQQLHFQTLSQETITTCLNSRGIDGETARIAASLAGGSLKKALEISGETALPERKRFLQRITGLSLREITPLFSTAEELAADKDSAMALLDLLTSYLRDILLLKGGGDGIVNADLLPLLEREAGRFLPERIMERIDHVAAARRALLRNVNTRLTLEVLFMRLAAQ